MHILRVDSLVPGYVRWPADGVGCECITRFPVVVNSRKSACDNVPQSSVFNCASVRSLMSFPTYG